MKNNENKYTVIPKHDVLKKQIPEIKRRSKEKEKKLNNLKKYSPKRYKVLQASQKKTLYQKLGDRINMLKHNPYPHYRKDDDNPYGHSFVYDAEHLYPHSENKYSMKLDGTDRIVYIINKRKKLVFVHEVLGHYSKYVGKK